MKLTKRDFVKAGAAAGVAALIAPLRATLAAEHAVFDLVVYNDLFPQAKAFAATLSERCAHVVAVEGDAGRLWYDTLRGLVDNGARRIVGMTTHADLLILETLARDKGLRIRQRNRVGGARLVHWVLL